MGGLIDALHLCGVSLMNITFILIPYFVIKSIFSSDEMLFSRNLFCLGKYSSIAASIPKKLEVTRERVGGYWILGTSGLVAGIVVLGGLTRLTESGLSMVDWNFVHFQAPRNITEWEEYFRKYQQFPEYQMRNQGMTVDEFKRIYWMEHAHRVYGRLLGLWILVPGALMYRRSSPFVKKAILASSGLVVFQGLLGWWMVKSGLDEQLVQDVPRVSQYRLTAHLGSALVLFLLSLRTGLKVLNHATTTTAVGHPRMIKGAKHMTGMIFATAVSGGLVAGLDAGMIYNSFPKMGTQWFPSDGWNRRLGLKNFTENPSLVQFVHRCLAISTLTGISAFWWYWRRRIPRGQQRRLLNALMAMGWLQASLGVTTLLLGVPIPVASLHQTGSLALLALGTSLTL